MTIDVNGLPSYCEQAGQGRPLLLLHGWGGKCESFLPLTRDFQGRFRVTALDFPGHGRTPEPPEAWSVSEYMEWTRALMDRLEIDKADIVAHSFGGRVAILLAATHPERVGRLVLTGSAGLIREPDGKKQWRSTIYRALKAVSGEKGREKLVQMFGSPDYKALTPSMRATFNRVIHQDLRPYLGKIRSSTLLIWGENDTETPLSFGEIMAREIPDAGLVTFPGCGHFAYLENYGDFRRIVEKFLEE